MCDAAPQERPPGVTHRWRVVIWGGGGEPAAAARASFGKVKGTDPCASRVTGKSTRGRRRRPRDAATHVGTDINTRPAGFLGWRGVSIRVQPIGDGGGCHGFVAFVCPPPAREVRCRRPAPVACGHGSPRKARACRPPTGACRPPARACRAPPHGLSRCHGRQRRGSFRYRHGPGAPDAACGAGGGTRPQVAALASDQSGGAVVCFPGGGVAPPTTVAAGCSPTERRTE